MISITLIQVGIYFYQVVLIGRTLIPICFAYPLLTYHTLSQNNSVILQRLIDHVNILPAKESQF